MIKKTRLVVSNKLLNEDMCSLAERHQQIVNAYLSVYPNSHIIITNIINEAVITIIDYKEIKEIVNITTRFVIEGQTRSLYTTIYYK